jgi:hypothetical protein
MRYLILFLWFFIVPFILFALIFVLAEIAGTGGILFGIIVGFILYIRLMNLALKPFEEDESKAYSKWLYSEIKKFRQTNIPINPTPHADWALWAVIQGFLKSDAEPPWFHPPLFTPESGMNLTSVYEWEEWIKDRKLLPTGEELPNDIPSPFENSIIKAFATKRNMDKLSG